MLVREILESMGKQRKTLREASDVLDFAEDRINDRRIEYRTNHFFVRTSLHAMFFCNVETLRELEPILWEIEDYTNSKFDSAPVESIHDLEYVLKTGSLTITIHPWLPAENCTLKKVGTKEIPPMPATKRDLFTVTCKEKENEPEH